MPEKKTRKPGAAGVIRKRRKPAGASKALSATELQAETPPEAVAELQRQIDADGGMALAVYREPYGGRWLVMAALPIDKVAPTPYQRNLSETHVRKLERVIGKIGRFLDPIIAVRTEAEVGPKYWTPNGHHRLSAMRTLGAKSITAIVTPEATTAYQILALNTEKAHNLRERALEVTRMYKELARLGAATEEDYQLEFEEAALITLGLCYEAKPRFGGGAYHPILRRVDQFIKKTIRVAIAVRQERADTILQLDEAVGQQVELLKSRGLTSPYLRTFVVARINPIRFRPKDAEPLSFNETLERMNKALAKFNPEKIKMEDLAKTGGGVEETE